MVSFLYFQTVNRVWKRAKISPLVWSVYERTLRDEPRTTNFLEGWHRRFQKVVSKHHPDIYEFIRHLKGEQSNTEAGIQRLIAGAKPKTARRRVILGNTRIRSIVQAYHQRSLNDYLRGLAMNIKY